MTWKITRKKMDDIQENLDIIQSLLNIEGIIQLNDKNTGRGMGLNNQTRVDVTRMAGELFLGIKQIIDREEDNAQKSR